MTIAARHYETGAENIATAHAIRKRLFNPANAFKAKPATLLPTQPTPIVRRPEWQTKAIYFDHHVKAWEWNRVTKLNRTRQHIATRCAELGVDYDEIVGKSLSRTLTEPRNIIWYELRVNFGLSYPAIAREFSERDHTTIMHGVKRIAKLRGETTEGKANSLDRLVKDRDLNTLVRQDFRHGMSMNDLAIKYDLSGSALTAIVKIEKWERDNRDRTNNSRSARINVAEMRKDYEARNSVTKIANEHGVSVRTVRRLASSNGWTRKGTE